MIFASDLDRTLVYSKKFCGDIPSVCVEVVKGKNQSFMTERALKLLKDISNNMEFIPVTTRSKEELDRITSLKELSYTYAIINNGGRIFINNKEDERWTNLLAEKIIEIDVNLDDIYKLFKMKFPNTPFIKEKCSDERIWVFVQDVESPLENFEEVKSYFFDLGWRMAKTGRKIYLMPLCMDKWEALKYINEHYLGYSSIIASGDSIMDLTMVANANIGIIPEHGEIAYEHGVITTRNSGILAGEEIISYVYNQMQNLKERASI